MAERIDARETPRLAMRGIRKTFGATLALDGVDITVRAGEIHALVGENGAGKSTLMKVLSGAIAPDAGAIHLDGVPYRPGNALGARRAGVAMISQELSLAPHLTVEQNIMLGMEPSRFGFVRQRDARKKSREALDQLGHEDILPTARVGALSIAEQQIVEIARALAIGCRVLILDEPTSSLTQQDITKLFSLLRRLRSQGHAIVYISHFLEEVTEIADTYTVLRDGQASGNGPISSVTIDELVRLMIGRQVDQLYPRSHRTPGSVLLDVSGLSGPVKPQEASLTLHRGEIFGIAGLIGAGRTEFLRSLFGLAPVASGVVRIGVYTGPASPARRWAQGAGYLSEDRGKEGLALSLSITENILMNLRRDVNALGFYRPAAHRERAAGWIRTLSIRSIGPSQTLKSLSGGNQQKVALARLLHEDVDILLLDEPTRGIDVASKSQIYELLNRLASGEGGKPPKGILLVSSYLPELMGICDRIAVMSRGRLGQARPATSWTAQALMLEAFGQGTTI
jgi:ribose transport system ATP-binding protein